MRLTTKGRYAVTAMMDLSLHQAGGPVTLNDIADNQAISLSYLEQLFAKLRKSGLVRGMRGPGGGYLLAHSADRISIADIILAVDEKVDVTRCGGKGNCQNGDRCLVHELWTTLSEKLYGFLNSITLGELMTWSNIQEVAARQDKQALQSHKVVNVAQHEHP